MRLTSGRIRRMIIALRWHSNSYYLTGFIMTVRNGLYSIRIEMKDGARGRATGVIVLLDGQILGGDTHFYYTGSYTFKNGKWRGELITHQHAEALGVTPLFGGREVACGFTGTYSDGESGGRRSRSRWENQRSVSCQADAKVIVIAGKERP